MARAVEKSVSATKEDETTAEALPLVACHECGQLYHMEDAAPGQTAKCGRCGCVLYRAKRNSIERSLTYALAALVLIVLSNSFPFMTFKVEGREQVNTLFTGVQSLHEQGFWWLAALVLGTSILFPLFKNLATLYVLLPLRFGRRLPGAVKIFRIVEVMGPWAMMEVYLLGVFVAYVNLIDIGQLELGVAVYSFVALILIMVAGDAALDPREVWRRFGATARAVEVPSRNDHRFLPCHACGQVNRVAAGKHAAHALCSRCGSGLHFRKTDSLNRTTALCLAAAVFYIPANVFPVMTVISFGKGQPDTIFSGVTHLIHAGMWPLAALVFFASVAVPMLKLFGLGYLVLSVHRGSTWRLRDRTLLYRIIEGIGRWSMIDIFMISILVGLVKLGQVATIEPGLGANSFAAVVVITMIASMNFDPRIMWDAAERTRAEEGHKV